MLIFQNSINVDWLVHLLLLFLLAVEIKSCLVQFIKTSWYIFQYTTDRVECQIKLFAMMLYSLQCRVGLINVIVELFQVVFLFLIDRRLLLPIQWVRVLYFHHFFYLLHLLFSNIPLFRVWNLQKIQNTICSTEQRMVS